MTVGPGGSINFFLKLEHMKYKNFRTLGTRALFFKEIMDCITRRLIIST